MLRPQTLAVLAAITHAVASVTTAADPGPLKPGPPVIFSMQTRDFTVEFAGDRAWTMQRVSYKGEVVAEKNGFYGTVFAAEGGKWIGTGHTDGGVEQVETVVLTVDGKPRELTDKAAYQGHRSEIHKRSKMGPLNLEAVYVVGDDFLLERHRYHAPEEIAVGTLYAFMHPWLARTTEWIAERADGTALEGKFDNTGDFKLKDDPKWTAIYDPDSHRAMLAWYPVPLVGQGIKTGYWDKTVYHKLYNQIYSHTSIPAGSRFEATVIVRGVESGGDTWKDAAKALAEDTRKRFESGAIRASED